MGQTAVCLSHAGAVLKSISGDAGDHARVATAQHSSHGLVATVSAQHAEGCQLDRSWLGVMACLDAGVCKVNACSKPYVRRDFPTFPSKFNVDDMKSGSRSACKVNTRFSKTSSAFLSALNFERAGAQMRL